MAHCIGVKRAAGAFASVVVMAVGTLYYGLMPASPTLDAWVREGTPPPASVYPRIDQGTLVSWQQTSTGSPALPGVRYPEVMLEVQAAVYSLYHMTDPGMFYNREDLWTVANQVGMDVNRQQATQPRE